MDSEIIETLKKAGKINLKAHKLAKKKIKPEKDLYKIGYEIDEFIKQQGAFPAWPTNISINNQAAHNSYDLTKEYIIKKQDVIKVDIGVSIDGYITDSAQTIVFTKENEKIRQASFQALISSKEFLEKNYKTATISEVSEIIENKINEFGFKPISNLTGHFIKRYVPHASPQIPNIKNNLDIKLIDQEFPLFAIEPFCSNGKGYVNEGSEILIFEYIKDKPIRNRFAKKLLTEIKEFNNMPFSEFWIGKDMDSFSKRFAIRELLKSKVLASYPVLVDSQESYVSQAETTFLITENKIIDLVNIHELY